MRLISGRQEKVYFVLYGAISSMQKFNVHLNSDALNDDDYFSRGTRKVVNNVWGQTGQACSVHHYWAGMLSGPITKTTIFDTFFIHVGVTQGLTKHNFIYFFYRRKHKNVAGLPGQACSTK